MDLSEIQRFNKQMKCCTAVVPIHEVLAIFVFQLARTTDITVEVRAINSRFPSHHSSLASVFFMFVARKSARTRADVSHCPENLSVEPFGLYQLTRELFWTSIYALLALKSIVFSLDVGSRHFPRNVFPSACSSHGTTLH